MHTLPSRGAQRTALPLFLAAIVGAAAAPAWASAETAPPAPEPSAEETKTVGLGDHVELSTGFITGARRYSSTSFAFRNGDAERLDGAGGLVAPFGKYPYDGIMVSGVRWDFRAVLAHVRMSVGFGLPFTSPSSERATGAFDVGGAQRQVSVQALQPYELRFGLGGEYAFGRLALYADLLGDVHIIRTALAVDGLQANYGATTFAFSAGAGARVTLKGGFFLTAGGEIGILGDVVWGAQLGAGYLFDT